MAHNRTDSGTEAATIFFRLSARQLVELEQDRLVIAYRLERYLVDLGEALAEWRRSLRRSRASWTVEALLREGE